MVQFFKRTIKYRSTSFPELVFLHDYLLIKTCVLLLRSADGEYLISLEQAMKDEKRRRRRRRRRAARPDDGLCGAPKDLTQEDLDLMFPQWEEGEELGGLPYLLYSDLSMHDLGWPTCRLLPNGSFRQGHLLRSIGIDAHGIEADDGVYVFCEKHVRANLPVRDAVSCVQCKTQQRKDNSWCFVVYEEPGGNSLYYVGQLQFFVRAQYCTEDGFDWAPGCAVPAETLQLAVIRLYECDTEVFTPGVRLPDPELGRPPEFIHIPNTGPAGGEPYFESAGTWVVELKTLKCQLVPTRVSEAGQYFMWANKASGRTGPVKLH